MSYLSRNIISTILFLLLIVIITSCSKELSEKELIVAQVGERTITVEEFVNNFEYGFSPLAAYGNSKPRETYLNHMVNELLLASEGIDKGFNNNLYIQQRLDIRKRENLLEKYYTHHVYNKVKIPEDKLQEAIKKSTAKFRMIIWPNNTWREANEDYENAKQKSLVEFIKDEIKKSEVKSLDIKSLETEFINYLDIRPDIFNEIKDLEIGKTSKPILIDGKYCLVQILNLHRESIKDTDLLFGARRNQTKIRLFNIQSDSISRRLRDSVLTPLNFRLNGRLFEKIAYNLYAWKQDGLPTKRSLVKHVNAANDTSKFYLTILKEIMDDVLYKSKYYSATVEDLFGYITYNRLSLTSSNSLDELMRNLHIHVAKMFKNKIYADRAIDEGFLDSLDVTKDIRIWEQKWTYDIYRNNVVKNIKIEKEEMEDYFKNRWRELPLADIDTTSFRRYKDDVYNAILHEKQIKILKKKLKQLKENYPVTINYDVLNKLELNDDAKSLQTSIFVTKRFSNKPLVPIVDMKWLHF